MAPCFEMQMLKERLDRLLGRLLRRERGPIVIARLLGITGVAQVRFRLPKPISRALCHR